MAIINPFCAAGIVTSSVAMRCACSISGEKRKKNNNLLIINISLGSGLRLFRQFQCAGGDIIFRDHVGLFPVRQSSSTYILEEFFHHLCKMCFVAVMVFV